MGDWQQVGENLVRHVSGVIYLRAKVAGKVIRRSLKTADLRLAKMKRDDILDAMRKAVVAARDVGAVRTIADAIGALSARTVAQPHLSDATKRYYREMMTILRETLPTTIHARQWTATEAAAWWRAIAKRYSCQRANNVLGMARRLGKLMVEIGLRIDDPTAKLRRVKIERPQLNIPSRETVDALIADIASQGKAHSAEAAAYVGFLAFAGCRHGQARAICWEHVDEDWITFPSGVSGTKRAETRKLPISAPLRAVLDSIRPEKPKGPVFGILSPKEALRNACERLGVPALRLHDLRHFFASHALELGVDVPTVARWLGHRDGGVLVLRTYGHVRDDHSLSSISKIR